MIDWILGAQGTATATWLSLFAAIFGLPAVYFNSKGAKSHAATAAKAADAANKAVMSLSRRIELSNASYSSGQIPVLIVLVQTDNYKEASSQFRTLKRSIFNAHRIDGDQPSAIREAMKLIERQLSIGAGDQTGVLKKNRLLDAINSLSDYLIEIERSATHDITSEQ